MVRVVATFAAVHVFEIRGELDRLNPFDHLEPKLVFNSKPKRRAVESRQYERVASQCDLVDADCRCRIFTNVVVR